MPIPAALIGGGASIIGGLFGRSGQSSANAANLAIARENREWQERMSNTAYQRATKDLEKAGLNRILALGSPSTTPSGNVATMENVNKPLQEGLQKGVTSALSAATVRQQIKNMKAQEALTKAQTRTLGGTAELGEGIGETIKETKGRLSPANIDYPNLWEMLKSDASSAKKKIGEIAESVNLNPFKARKLLIETVDKMDLPPMTDAQKYEWALKHPEEIKKFLARQKQRGF